MTTATSSSTIICYNHGTDSYIMQSWLVRQALLFSFNLLVESTCHMVSNRNSQQLHLITNNVYKLWYLNLNIVQSCTISMWDSQHRLPHVISPALFPFTHAITYFVLLLVHSNRLWAPVLHLKWPQNLKPLFLAEEAFLYWDGSAHPWQRQSIWCADECHSNCWVCASTIDAYAHILCC